MDGRVYIFWASGCTGRSEIKNKRNDSIFSTTRGDAFYVGTQGAFDRMVLGELETIAKENPIQYYVVLAYFPTQDMMTEQTILPDGIEQVHPRFAISWRNDWMIEKSEIVVAYVYRSYGGAARHTEKARRKGKEIINLYEEK